MRITYDSKVDALYIRFIETTVTTEHVAEGIAVDYDSEGRIASYIFINQKWQIVPPAPAVQSSKK